MWNFSYIIDRAVLTTRPELLCGIPISRLSCVVTQLQIKFDKETSFTSHLLRLNFNIQQSKALLDNLFQFDDLNDLC